MMEIVLGLLAVAALVAIGLWAALSRRWGGDPARRADVVRRTAAEGDRTEAARLAAEWEREDPRKPSERIALATAFAAAGEHQRALEVLDSTHVPARDAERVRRFREVELLAAGRTDEADALVADALAGDPDAAATQELLLIRAHETGGLPTAEDIDRARAVLAEDPTSEPARLTLAVDALGAGRWSQAIGYLESLTAPDEHSPSLQLLLGTARLGAGDAEGAETAFTAFREGSADPVRADERIARARTLVDHRAGS
jgi:predicted Zn-dependent protease